MSKVDTLWSKIYKAPLYLFGIPFTVIGILFYLYDGNLAFIINGVLWILIGIGIKTKDNQSRKKLDMLKRIGKSYQGSVISIQPAYGVKIGTYVTAQVECAYETAKGKFKVKSGYHLLSPFDSKEGLEANIYVDYSNQDDCSVELFRTNQGY